MLVGEQNRTSFIIEYYIHHVRSAIAGLSGPEVIRSPYSSSIYIYFFFTDGMYNFIAFFFSTQSCIFELA